MVSLQYEAACEILRLELLGLRTVHIYLGLSRPRDWLKASLVYISNDPYSLKIEEEHEEQIKKIARIFRGLKEGLILRGRRLDEWKTTGDPASDHFIPFDHRNTSVANALRLERGPVVLICNTCYGIIYRCMSRATEK
jgi:hypothetical protein